MQFLLLDKLTNEFTGLFETKEEAEFYYLKKHLVERLRVYMYKLMNKTELMENIELIRNFENLISEIRNYEKDEEYQMKYNYFINRADVIFSEYCYTIPDNIPDNTLYSKISSINYKVYMFKENEFHSFKINK